MKKLKESLNFRGFPEKNEIVYYDGEEKVLEVEDFQAIWSLLESYRLDNKESQLNRRYQWQKEFNITDEESQEFHTFLKDNGFLYENSMFSSKQDLSDYRNFNYFNIYDQTTESKALLNKIANLHIVIIGVGTVGATLVLTLAKLGIKHLTIIDYDRVEKKNIRAQFLFDYEDEEKSKVQVIKEKMASIEPECEIQIFDRKVRHIDDLKSLDLDPFQFLFGCFDESSEDLHRDISSYAASLSSKYISLGYFNDSTIANDLTSLQGKTILHASYQQATPYFISENRGTVIQSLTASLLISKIMVDYLLKKKTNSHLSFGLEDLNYIRVENNEFMLQLSQLMPLEELEIRSILDYISNLIEAVPDIPMHLEIEILSMYQVFDLLVNLNLLEEYNLSEVYQEFLGLIEKLDRDKIESTVYYSEELYSEYLELVKNIRLPDLKNSHIYEVLLNLNTVEDYNKRVEYQRMSHEALVKQGNKLLHFFNTVKKNYVKVPLHEYYQDTLGVGNETVELFKELIEDHQTSLSMLFGKTLFPSEESMIIVDYLYDNPYSVHPAVEDIETSKELIMNSLKSQLNNPFMIRHLEKMFTGAHIKVIEDPNHHGVNRTYYFPQTKDNKIILSYKGSLEDFYILCHELGHSYYNNMYSHSYFENSRQILNEALAYLFELKCVQSILCNDDVPDKERHDVHTHYLHRVNKIVLSQYSIYQLEDALMGFVMEKDGLTLSDYLTIQQELDKKVTPENIFYINQEYTHMNALLNTSFVFGYRDHITDPIAYLLAFSLISKYKGKEHILDLKVKQALENDCTQFEDFVNEFLTDDEDVYSFISTGITALKQFITLQPQTTT
ncbi:ThiF family adenylyltransferase [Rossellomorea sp. SC111]|uniref:ThiF family adenylyltransferase n=1 Tax=Rossellomorea sp. SC111 TaxID=2968985 RepID=UPI00215B7312|nr:ThiF family adenylyltransferase [Rossellomorea sp. SC111]MCR8850511.1 ThiF family adenylyltransferase [Rossellomorea sp. SC111]